MQLTQDFAGSRGFDDYLTARMGGGSVYEDSIPTMPTLLDEWLGNIPPGTVWRNLTVSLWMPSDGVVCRTRIFADIHQNSLFLTEVLKCFGESGVSAIFALGDYCFMRHPDDRHPGPPGRQSAEPAQDLG